MYESWGVRHFVLVGAPRLARGVPLGPGGRSGPSGPSSATRVDVDGVDERLVHLPGGCDEARTRPNATDWTASLTSAERQALALRRPGRLSPASRKKYCGVLSLCCPERIRLRNSAKAGIPSCWSYWENSGSPSRTRTCDHSINRCMTWGIKADRNRSDSTEILANCRLIAYLRV